MPAHQPVLQMNGWISVPWAVYTGQGGGNEGMDGALGHGPSGNQQVFTILVGIDDVQTAITEICGSYKFNNDTAEHYLDRKLPKQHPWQTWLFANRVVSIKPMVASAKTNRGVGSFPVYRYAMLTILFTQPHYPILSDGVLDANFAPINIGGVNSRQEWERFCLWTPQGGIEAFVKEAGQSFKWAEGTGVAQPLAGDAFPSPQMVTIPKGTLTCVWYNVPMYGLLSPTTRRPENIIAALGTINSVAFRNYPIGTLRFDNYVIQWNEAPYPPDALQQFAGNGMSEFAWPSLTGDVTLNWTHWDPPHSHSGSRGHNLAPYRSLTQPDPDASWYLITVDGNAAHAGIYSTSDHRLIFRRSN